MSDLDLAGRRILLVEDEYLIARLLGELLETWGATIVGPAATTERALALLAQTDRIDFAMVDINLHGVPAFPVADALVARGVPLVLTTGYGTSMIPERYRHIATFRKPFNAAGLAKALSILKC